MEAATAGAGAEAVDAATVGSEKVVSDEWLVISGCRLTTSVGRRGSVRLRTHRQGPGNDP